VKAHRLLSIDRADYPTVAILAPVFALSSACTVILASLGKALFLSANPISLLPWMFLGSSLLTAGTSLGYVALMRTMTLGARFLLLLTVAATSFLVLRVVYPLQPAALGVAILLWCPAAGHLLLVQTWNLASTLLPTRQGKRLLPVLAAVTTLGAAIGGGLVQVGLRWVKAEDLLVLSTLTLVYPLMRIRPLIAGLGGETPAKGAKDAKESDETTGAEKPTESGWAAIAKKPLLADLALLTFLLQAASLVVDYQLSAELKPQFDKEGIASFLGTFYWSSNLVVLAVTLVATSRFVRLTGIGVALAASSIVLGAGSLVYVVAAFTAAVPAFWVIVATSFGERVAQYALSRPAMQMVYMPLQTRGGERAKTLIDGVVYRLATAAVSILLVLVAPDLRSQFRFSPAAVLACLAVVYLGVRIGPHYKQALTEALRARRLDAATFTYLRDALGGGQVREVEERLASDDPHHVLRAIEVARDLGLVLEKDRLERLAGHEDARVACAALKSLEGQGHTPSAELLETLLDEGRPPKVLRAILQLLSENVTPEIIAAVRPLASHPDASVASAACVFRIRAAGGVDVFEGEVQGGKPSNQEGDQQGDQPGDKAAKALYASNRITGMTRAGDFARELADLTAHPAVQVRRDAIEQMGQLGLPYFIAPLIGCLAKSDARREAAEALVRFGARALPRLADHVDSDDLSLAARSAVLKVIERLGSAQALAALVTVARERGDALRDHAVEAIWRMTADERAPRPEPALLEALVLDEIARLQRYSAIEVLLGGRITRRRGFFIGELSAQQLAAERRAFRLLALLFNREAVHRAFLHYKSDVQRVRSNAIELLEQHIKTPALAAFVPLVERQEDAKGNLRPRSVVLGKLAEGGDVGALLTHDPWLARVWSWAKQTDKIGPDGKPAPESARAEGGAWDDELDRLLQVKQLPMFTAVSGQELLPLVEGLERRACAKGDVIYRAGDDGRSVYWLLDGEVRLLRSTGRELVVRRHECFGEMSALDGLPRSATARAAAAATLVELPFERFEDAIELHPSLLRQLVGVLSRRLREAI
jgi:CRP/FNR family cyclic AMP-dependent transcriptional regulator